MTLVAEFYIFLQFYLFMSGAQNTGRAHFSGIYFLLLVIISFLHLQFPDLLF